MSQTPRERSEPPESGLVLSAGRRSGFVDCGIAGCEPSDYGHALDAWLSRGAHGEMDWMERTAAIRKDLRQKWDWARSALVGVAEYLVSPRRRDGLNGIARYVSRYARGTDYHEQLRHRLARWAAEVEQVVGHPFRHAALVDTSAVLERELAVRAGLGWFGKNTCLIGPDGDSWRFIGVLLTDLALGTTGQALSERCGSCRACMDACPSSAITEPWFVDASRCVSYLTIEKRGSIPEPLRASIEDWLFGCDVCQEVCPWNRRAAPSEDDVFRPRPELERTSLAELVRMDEEAFRSRFRGSPLMRAKHAGMVRNAMIVGANEGIIDVIEAARERLDDPDPVIRETARWVVER